MSEIKNLKRVANRISKAIKSGQRIILYGDADPDGISSVIILKETIETLGGKDIVVYLPNREKEGYGINEKALSFLKKFAPALLISLDCGIGNFKEVKIAKKSGFEVIIIDHHQILDKKIPEAEIVVDPNQPGDKYPFKFLTAAGIAFRLSQILIKKMADILKRSFLELVAISTIADMAPETDENKDYIEQGLESLETTFRPGLRAFWQIDSIKQSISTREAAQRIIAALNSGEPKDHTNESYLLLTCSDEEEAQRIAKDLLEKSYQRHERIKEITAQVEKRILAKPNQLIIFEGSSSWPLVLLGSVASRICRLYKKPTFLFKIVADGKAKGAVRVPQGIDSVKAMASCSKLLITYGGHPPASGFSIESENLEKFKKCLINYFAL